MTSLDEITHNHDHICVNCDNELFEANETTTGRKKFLCIEDGCEVAITFCNGDMSVTTVTVDDLVESARDIFSYLEDSKGFEPDQIQSVSAAQKSLRKMIQNEKERLVSNDLHEDIQDKFGEFTDISKTLYEKEQNEDVLQSPNGEEVLELNGLYHELSNVLLYTILFYPEQEEGDLYQRSIDPDEFYEDFETEPYKVELESAFEEADLLVK